MPESFKISDLPIPVMDRYASDYVRNWFGLSLDKIDREKISRSQPLIKEQDMNIQEKTVVKSFMEITHGPGAALDDLIIAAGYFHSVEAQLMVMGLPIPKSFQEALKAVDRDLNLKMETEKEKQLRDLQYKREGLLSNEEKLKAVEAEIAKLLAEDIKKI
jgi:hypothetical protein